MPQQPVRILYIEPFHGGSHQAFGELLMSKVSAEWTPLTLSGRHWKWRSRGSAVYFALEHAGTFQRPYDLVWASSFLDLAALYALVPTLLSVPSVLYFHENQLAYPVRPEHANERDTHFGFSQMISALAATRCVFNSTYNLESFCGSADELLKRMPDAKPLTWTSKIREKAEILAVPMRLDPRPLAPLESTNPARHKGPIILWNHRWEYDKAPDIFFKTLQGLKQRGVPFRLLVCGERYRRVPAVFETAPSIFEDHLIHWGYFEDRQAYLDGLQTADIAVSTAHHEFFGLSMLEATHAGAYPLVPDRLSYQELFPDSYRYPNDDILLERLTRLCLDYVSGKNLRENRRHLTDRFGDPLIRTYQEKIDLWSRG